MSWSPGRFAVKGCSGLLHVLHIMLKHRRGTYVYMPGDVLPVGSGKVPLWHTFALKMLEEYMLEHVCT